MGQITDAAIPVAELQTDHRVDEHSAVVGIIGIDFIAYIEREKRIERTDTA